MKSCKGHHLKKERTENQSHKWATDQQQGSWSSSEFLKWMFSTFIWFSWAPWAASCSPIHLQAPVQHIYLIALKRVCTEMIRNHGRVRSSPTWRVPHYTASLSSSLIFADHCLRLRFGACICPETLVLVPVRPTIFTLFVRSALWFLSVLPARPFVCLFLKFWSFVFFFQFWTPLNTP